MKDSKTDILLEEISESLKELNQNLKEALTSITTELSGIKKKYQICNTLNLLFFLTLAPMQRNYTFLSW